METETRELSSVSRGKIKPQETDDWKNEKLFVPPLPPTNLRGCHLIRIQYDVFVSLNLKWFDPFMDSWQNNTSADIFSKIT